WDRLWNAPEAGIADSTLDEAGAALAGLGLRSALSQRLRADRRRLTVLTVYARKPHAFDDSTRRLAGCSPPTWASPSNRPPCGNSSPRPCAPGTSSVRPP